jgi:hypothetical protein
MNRREFMTLLGAAAAVAPLAPCARAQAQAPRIVFAPPLGTAQDFRVNYRYRGRVPGLPAPAGDLFVVSNRLTVTPIAREKDGYRLRLLVSEVKPARQDEMNMVMAAALMLEGLPFEMLVDARGSLEEVADWPDLRRQLRERADSRLGRYSSVGYSLTLNDEKQVAWHLARSIDAMNFARSYLEMAERTGASTISWYGSRINVNVEPANAEGAVAMSWTADWTDGRALFRPDGFTAQLMRSASPSGGAPGREIVSVEALAAK